MIVLLALLVPSTSFGRQESPEEDRPPKKMALRPPTDTPHRPQGIPALTVRPTAAQPFAKEDLVKYFKTHNLPKNVTTTADFQVDTLEFTTAKDIAARLKRPSVGFPDADRLAFVTLSGKFAFTGPPGVRLATFRRAYAVFDALNGNLLRVGSLKSEPPSR
jgi:hypothetical protein